MPDFQSNVNAPGAPNYAAPLLDFSTVGDLPKTAFEGQQRARTTQQQTMFRNGIPKTPDGQNDYGAMTNKLLEMSDFDNAGKVAGIAFGQQALTGSEGNPEAPGYRGGTVATQQPGKSGSTTTAAPITRDERPAVANNTDGFTAPGASPTTQPSAPYNEPPRIQAALNQYDHPNNPDIETRLRNLGMLMKNPYYKDYAKLRSEYLLKQQEQTPTEKDFSAGRGGAGYKKITAETEGKNRELSPTQKDFPVEDGGAGPRKITAETAGKNREMTGEQKNLQPGAGGSAAQQQEDIKVGGANRTMTPEQKNLQPGTGGQSATEQQEALKRRGTAGVESDKINITDFNKEYGALQALEQQSFNGIQKADLAQKGLINNPNFYSGPLNKTVEMYQQFKSVFGNDPASAVPQEAFQKVVNDMLNEQIKALGKSGVGRVLQVEVQNMQKAIASLGITAASNRVLLGTVSRVYQQSQDLASIAREVQVRTKGDPAAANNMLNEAVSAYYREHPIYTEQEKRDPRLIGAPEVPPQVRTPEQVKMWAKMLGLPPGYPARFNGKIGAIP